MTSNLHKLLFNPESIAVIGASNDKLKTGGRVTDNIKSNGYKGKLWAINPGTPSIMNLPTFKKHRDHCQVMRIRNIFAAFSVLTGLLVVPFYFDLV